MSSISKITKTISSQVNVLQNAAALHATDTVITEAITTIRSSAKQLHKLPLSSRSKRRVYKQLEKVDGAFADKGMLKTPLCKEIHTTNLLFFGSKKLLKARLLELATATDRNKEEVEAIVAQLSPKSLAKILKKSLPKKISIECINTFINPIMKKMKNLSPKVAIDLLERVDTSTFKPGQFESFAHNVMHSCSRIYTRRIREIYKKYPAGTSDYKFSILNALIGKHFYDLSPKKKVPIIQNQSLITPEQTDIMRFAVGDKRTIILQNIPQDQKEKLQAAFNEHSYADSTPASKINHGDLPPQAPSWTDIARKDDV
jgi:hypothetical protein